MSPGNPRYYWICGATLLALLGAPVASYAARPSTMSALCKPDKEKRAKKKAAQPKEPSKARDARAPEEAPAPTPPPDEEGRALQRGERVEFDARLIQGQTAKAGAVYLFARVSTNLRSMVKERSSFRDEIVRTVFQGEGAPENKAERKKVDRPATPVAKPPAKDKEDGL